MPLPTTLGAKAPGQLIKSEDWNALVAGVNAIEAALDTRISGVEATVAALDTRVGTAETNITGLRTDVDAILATTFRITLSTTKVNFAIGELAEITATVRDARGEIPSDIATAAPWVDFVASWGHLKPAPGFTAKSGVAERSISVQANAQGIAKVRLSSEIVHDMSDDLEFDFSGFLQTQIGPQNRTFSDIVLESNTPSDAQVTQAYQAMTLSYDNPQVGSVRDYADSYYVANGTKLSGKVSPALTNLWRQRWRDHHITVLAFGKTDGDPLTPDAARGANAIQVTFRDWLGPWIIIDYIPNFTVKVPQLVNVFQGAITNDYQQSANRMKDLVQQRVQTFGLLGKTREYEAMRGALDQVNPSQPVPFLGQLKDSMKSAVTLQQSFQMSQISTPGGGSEEVALQAFTGTAVRADSAVSGVNAQVQQVQAQVLQVQNAMQQQFAAVQQNVTALGGRLDATTSAGGQIDQLRSNLNNVSDQVSALRALGDPSTVNNRLNFIDSLDNRLTRIERGIP
jgi:hypothetical protein